MMCKVFLSSVALIGTGAAAFLPSPGARNARQGTLEQPVLEAAQAAGAAACKTCHPAIFAAWESSHHGRTSRALATPPGGADMAIGSSWMQVYLRRDASGLHRIIDESFDVQEQVWRDVDEILDAIRGPLLSQDESRRTSRPRDRRSFEVDCSGCHVSEARLRRDAEQGRIVGGWRAASIDCEACHGPARAHVDAWRRLDAGEALLDLGRLDARAASSVCARCHGGSGVSSGFSPRDAQHWAIRPRVGPGQSQGVFAHGAASGQVYQSDAFLRSACHLEGGLACTDCHAWHTDELLHTEHADALCSRCHVAQTGREHTHHAADGEGGRCINCHMPKLVPGRLAHQRDHRISSPLPAAPEAPDACTACHRDQDKTWAAKWAVTWWGPPPAHTLDAVRGVQLARLGELERARPLLERARTHPQPFFRWASAVWLGDPSALLGESLIESRLLVLELASRVADGTLLLRAGLGDPSPVVRANAWVALQKRGEARGDPPVADLEIAARISRTRAGLRVVLARAYLAQQRIDPAIDLLEETVVFGPRALDAWLTLAGAYALAGRDAPAASAVRRWRRTSDPLSHLKAFDAKVSRSGDTTLERAVLTAVIEHSAYPGPIAWARTRREEIE